MTWSQTHNIDNVHIAGLGHSQQAQVRRRFRGRVDAKDITAETAESDDVDDEVGVLGPRLRSRPRALDGAVDTGRGQRQRIRFYRIIKKIK